MKATINFHCKKINIGVDCLSEVYDLEGLINILKGLQDENHNVKILEKGPACDEFALKQIDEEKIKDFKKQIGKFLDSKFARTVLLVFTNNKRVSLGLLKINDKVEISFSLSRRKYSEHEQPIMDFFLRIKAWACPVIICLILIR